MPFCYTCNKRFHSLGIMRHRAMHRDKKQNCTIGMKHGEVYTYYFDGKPKPKKKGLTK